MVKKQDYRQLDGFETKRIPTFIKETDEAKGIVEHFVAIFGNVDEGGDLIEQGAFRKTLSERGRKVRVLDQHNTDSVLRVIGKPLELREVGREMLTPEVLAYAPEATGGLLVRTQYAIETDNGRNAFRLVQGGYVDESSIGYDAPQVAYRDIEKEGAKRKVRVLKEIRLWEYSSVIWGMNDATTVVGVKETEGAEGEEIESKTGAEGEIENNPKAEGGKSEDKAGPEIEGKAVTPFQDLPLAERRRSWNNAAAEKRVRAWAGGEDLDWDKYRQAHLWYDADKPELLGSYKLLYADVIGGQLTAVPRGIFSIAGSLRGARGKPARIGDDKERVKGHVARYYAKMKEEFEDDSMVAPWDKTGEAEREMKEGAEEKGYGGRQRYLGDCLQGHIHLVFTTLADKFYISGLMNREERILLSELIGDALDILANGMPADLDMREVEGYWEVDGYYREMMAVEPELSEKAGRVLSRRNTERLQQMAEGLQRALAEIHEILTAAGLVEGEAAGGEDEEEMEEEKEKSNLLRLLELEQAQLEMEMLTLS